MAEAAVHPVVREDLAALAACGLPWERLSGNTVVVSGAGGFLPSYMVAALLHMNRTRGLGVRVVGLVRDPTRAVGPLGRLVGFGPEDGLQLAAQDVCRPLKYLGPVDWVVHAASPATPKAYGKDPVGTLSANVLGAHNLLEAARERGCKGFLYLSSGEVYGEVGPEQVPTAETDYGYLDPMLVRSCYAESKRMAETMCVSWRHQHGVPTVVARPFHTYGPGMDLTDGRVFSDFVADVVARRDIVLKSAGTARRTFCYVADATEAFFTLLFKGQGGEAYNVSHDGCETSIRELAELVAGLFPGFGLAVDARQGEHDPDYMQSPITRNFPDIGKIRALGWAPRTGLAEGFRRTIRSFL